MIESNSNSSETTNWHEELANACSDLSSDNSTEALETFLINHADDLKFNELKDVRSRIVVAISNKNGHKLSGSALRSHAEKCSGLTEEVNELISAKKEKFDPAMADIKHLHAIAEREERKEQRREEERRKKQQLKLAESRKVTGEKETYTYKGVEVVIIQGKSAKGKDMIQVINMKGGKLNKVTLGQRYERDALPQQLKFAMSPELEKSYFAQRRAEAEAERIAKKQKSGKGNQKKKEKGKKMSKEERKQARKNAA